MVVGGYALGVHGHPRATKDLDLWVEPSAANARRVMTALQTFGAPLHGLTLADLVDPEVIFQIGQPPNRVDILPAIDGVEFRSCWARRAKAALGGVESPVIAREDLIANKRASGRPQDLADVEALEPAR